MRKLKCYWCGRGLSKKQVTIDHLVPLQYGGSNDKSNKVVSCSNCNNTKSNKIVFKGKDVYELTGVEKPTFIKKSEKVLGDLRFMKEFNRFYKELSEDKQHYILNCLILAYDNDSCT